MTDTKGNVELGPRSPRFPSSKFCAPRAAPHLVHRSRLIGELDRGQGARLTLVVGSAGAGKTALLADWAATAPQRTMAWLSCDDADADPVRFVAAMIEALRRSPGQPYIGEDARELLSLDGEVSADVIAALTDDLQRLGGPEVLVIDDFHLTGTAGVEALALLVEYRPASLQLVVASRVDPQLRLHRMRVNQELVELREADLSFSAEEASAFLSGFGLGLSEPDLAVVYRRSEGWAAGLQMAAISIKQSPDPVSAAGRVAAMQLGLEDLFDQLVVAIGGSLVVQGRHEHVGAVRQLEEGGRPRAAQSGAGGHRQFVEDRGGQHEVDDFGRLAVEDLVQEEPGHAMAMQVHPAGSTNRVRRLFDRNSRHL